MWFGEPHLFPERKKTEQVEATKLERVIVYSVHMKHRFGWFQAV
jgi:hypothetical protein